MPSLSHSQRAIGKVSDWFKAPSNPRLTPARSAAASSGSADRSGLRSSRSAPAWITHKKTVTPPSGSR